MGAIHANAFHGQATTTMNEGTSAKTRKLETSLIQSKLPFGGSTRIGPSKASSSSRATSKKKADILISIKPVHMNNIVNQTKNHEFRKYMISKTVQRMW